MGPSTENIATFVQVVRQQSLSGAARVSGLPKSTISRRLMRLEAQLRTQLLQRDARKVTLTAAGRSFYASVSSAIDALDAAVLELEHSSREPRGTIRLTAPADLGRMVLTPLFVAFLERFPEMELDLVITNRMVDLVQEGIDLAVRAGRATRADLIARKLCDSELHLCARPSLAAGLAREREIRALEHQPFVLHQASGRAQTLRLERGTGKRRQSVELRVSGRVNVDDFAAMAELVAAGQGIGLLPSMHVHEGIQAGRLERLFPEWSSRAGHVYLVYPSRQQPERVRLLPSFLLEAFQKIARV